MISSARLVRSRTTSRLFLSDLMPLDITGALRNALAGDAREPDHKLHASSHLTAPLRHVQLELSGAAEKPRSIADEITLMTGTQWHSYLNRLLFDLRLPVMMEVKLDAYMPEGWSGTADWIIWNPEYQAFLLSDLKTIRGAGLPWIISGGAKEAHMFQLSAYFWALKRMGLPLVDQFTILYLPKDAVPGKDVQPTLVECKPIDEALILAHMANRKNEVDLYLAGMEALAPVPPREAKRIWNAKAKTLDLVLKPHWSSMYCRFIDCGCSEQSQEKIGHFVLDGSEITYFPRKGYERPEDLVTPYMKEFK